MTKVARDQNGPTGFSGDNPPLARSGRGRCGDNVAAKVPIVMVRNGRVAWLVGAVDVVQHQKVGIDFLPKLLTHLPLRGGLCQHGMLKDAFQRIGVDNKVAGAPPDVPPAIKVTDGTIKAIRRMLPLERQSHVV